MNHFIDTFERQLKELKEAREKWEELGHRVSLSRVGSYEKILADLVQMGPDRRGEIKPPSLGEIILTLSEIQDFLFVSRVAVVTPRLAQSPRVKKIFCGPDLARDETPTSRLSRNTLFELTIACVIERAGMVADISGETDVKTSFEGYSVLIECKRPQNLRKAERNIDSAAAQFWKRPSQPPFLNLIALCLSKAITGGDHLLVTNSAKEVVERLEKNAEEFRLSLQRHWIEKTHVSGLLTRVKFCGSARLDARPFNAELLQMTNNPNLGFAEIEILARFAGVLKSGLPGFDFQPSN